MATKVNFTKTGMGIDEGILIRWLKALGEQVEENELIAEIETAKAIQEVTAPVSGTLREILVQPGETIEVNTTLALIE